MSQNQLLLTLEKSLTMKQYHNPTNKSDGMFPVSFSVHPPFILRSSSGHPPFKLRSSSVRAPFKLRSSSVQAPFILRSSSVQAPFELRSSSVHPPFELRSSSVRAPFILRSSSVRAPFGNRRSIEDRSKIDRRMNGESSEARRRCVETLVRNQEKDDSNKNFIFNHLNSNYYGNLMNFARCPKNMRGVRRLKQAICLFLVSK